MMVKVKVMMDVVMGDVRQRWDCCLGVSDRTGGVGDAGSDAQKGVAHCVVGS